MPGRQPVQRRSEPNLDADTEQGWGSRPVIARRLKQPCPETTSIALRENAQGREHLVGHMVTSAVTSVFGPHRRLDCESKPEEARKSGTLILP